MDSPYRNLQKTFLYHVLIFNDLLRNRSNKFGLQVEVFKLGRFLNKSLKISTWYKKVSCRLRYGESIGQIRIDLASFGTKYHVKWLRRLSNFYTITTKR